MDLAKKFMPKLVKFGILGLVLVGLNGTATQAQRSQQPDGSIDLLSLGCSTSGYGYLDTEERENVSVGKQIFKPVFIIKNTSSNQNPFLITCPLSPSGQPKSLQVMAGVMDYAMKDDHEIIFNVYLDGQPTASHKLYAGEGKTLLFDVTKSSSVALEAICSVATYCPNLYFLKTLILPSPTSSITNSNSTAFNNTKNTDPFNNAPQPAKPPLEESSWGNNTLGEEEETSNSSSSSGSGNLNDTIEDVNTIIDIFK